MIKSTNSDNHNISIHLKYENCRTINPHLPTNYVIGVPESCNIAYLKTYISDKHKFISVNQMCLHSITLDQNDMYNYLSDSVELSDDKLSISNYGITNISQIIVTKINSYIQLNSEPLVDCRGG
jgi:hypothetical protein